MTPEKIVSVIRGYQKQLEQAGIPKKRMDPNRTFGSLSQDERLAHAHFLCDGALQFAANPEKYGKANRHLASIQHFLGFSNWYTLEELMNHNRPDGSENTKQMHLQLMADIAESSGPAVSSE